MKTSIPASPTLLSMSPAIESERPPAAIALEACRRRRGSDPPPPESPRTRGPPVGFVAVLRPSRLRTLDAGQVRSATPARAG